MPKLTRLHLTGIGHKDAKFDKLSVRFTNDRGQPAHTLLWLPNGGGKSLLIAFKYAALRPHKNDFLVQKTGRGADLIDFIEPGKLGVVLLEFEDTELGTGRRIVGYAALRRDRDLERWFFTFRAHPSLAWESLPVRGLGTPAPTLLKLRQHFQAAHAQDRARIEYFETDNQSRWSTYLRDRIGLDPEIFRHHLVMNSDEGGVIKVFAHRDLDAFVRLFLELAVEPESLFKEDAKGRLVDQAREAVADYKRSVLENPRRELTRDLCADLLPVLRNLQANLSRRQELGVLVQTAEAELARLKRSLVNHFAALQGQLTELEKKIETMQAQKTALKNEFNKFERWADGYECLRKRKYFEETLEWHTKAAGDLTRAEYRLKLLTAARAAVGLRTARANLDALNEERAQKLAKLKPDLDAIQTLGGQLAFWLEDRSARLEEEQNSIGTRENQAKNAVIEAAREFNQIQLQLGQHRRDYNNNKTNLAELDKARRRLRAESLVDPDESPEQAAERWTRLNKDLREEHRLATVQRDSHLSDANAARTRREEAQQDLNRIAHAREAVEKEQSRLQRLVAELRSDPGFLAAGGTSETSPWNPTLSTALEGKVRAHRERIVDLQIAGADDQRVLDRFQPPERPLFPPPREIEVVLELLRRQQVRTALPAYSELAAAHAQTSAAENALRAAPAEMSGILIQDRDDFERARRAVREAPISRPVVILHGGAPSPRTADPTAAVHVVLPQDRGLWNAAMAKADVHSVNHRCDERQRLITEAEKLAREAERALQRVEQIRSEFAEDQPGEWQQSLESLSTEEGATRARIASADREREKAEQAAEEIKRHLPGLLTEAEKAQTNANQLAVHLARFEQHAEQWRARDAELVALIEEATRAETAASTRKTQTEATLLSFPPLWQDLRARQVALEFDRRRLSPGYVGAQEALDPSVAPDTLWGKFESQIRLYEDRVNDEGLKARHSLASTAVSQAQSEFNTAAKGLPAPLIDTESRAPELDRKLATAYAELETAKADETLARNEHARATAECPLELRKHNARETIDDTRPAANRLEAERLRDECRADMEAKGREREAHDERLHERETARADLKAVLPRYEGLLEKCEDVAAAEASGHAEFRGEPESDQALTKRLLQALQTQRKLLEEAEDEAEKLFKNRWTRTLTQERFMRDDLALRRKLADLAQPDLERKITEHLKTLDDIHAACESELAALASRRANLVAMLAERAELAARRLHALQRVSVMPKELDAWGGHPFLRVELRLRNDPAERAHHLGNLVERWARETQEDALPTGAGLAHDSLKALLVGGQLSIRVLKPTQRLELVYHDITALAGFSEGQRLTAAILIYCVLVRLRRQNSAQSDGGLSQDAGYLLLDNPLGKANHTALVDLQLRVAHAMGVQLIYASGINDPGALVHFGHIVRLKNSALDPRTGDKLVQIDTKASNYGTLSAAELGVQPRAIVPPPPPKPLAAGAS